jgi:hypothetical protein
MGKCYICGSTKAQPHNWYNDWNNRETDIIEYCLECEKFVTKAWYSLFENQNNDRGWLKSESEFRRLFDAAKDMYLKKTNAASIPPPEKDPVYVSTTSITDHVRIHKNDDVASVKKEIFKIGDLINLKDGYLDSMPEDWYKNRLNKVKWPTKIVDMEYDCIQIMAEIDAGVWVSRFYVNKVENIKGKVDPYKEHEKKLKGDPRYQQFLLNQHTCDICGKTGNSDFCIMMMSVLKDSYRHGKCNGLINDYATITGISREESAKIIKEKLFSSSKQNKVEKKKEQQVLCSADFFENPWRR